MLLWTTHVTDAHRPILEDIKRPGTTAWRSRLFEATPDQLFRPGAAPRRDRAWQRTAITVIRLSDKNRAVRRPHASSRGDRVHNHCVDCSEALGARQLAGPLHQTLGHFSGAAATEEERARAREVHQAAGDYAQARDVRIVLEAINRFESYFLQHHGRHGGLSRQPRPSGRHGMYDTFHANIEEQDPRRGVHPKHPPHQLRPHLGE
jgi:D-psicose/D-tagatose/L-ribulose 3-epimerase